MTLKDFSIGQPVYLLKNDGYGKRTTMQTALVKKIGRTYLTVTYGIQTMKFLPSEQYWVEKTEWGYPTLLFESKERRTDFLEKVELEKWLRSIGRRSEMYTIEQLRAVKKILETESGKKE